MTDEHARQREALGAYVLGGLDRTERRTVEAHLDVCDSCSQEVARLAGLPALLARLTREEAEVGLLAGPPPAVESLVRGVARTRARERRRLVRWRAATAAAALVAAVAVAATWPDPEPDRVVAAAEPAVAAASATEGTAAALEWDWGTTVEIDLTGLPQRPVYQLMAVASDGRRQQAGVWGATDTHSARVRGASAIQRDDLDRVEVTDDSGEVLVTFDF